MNNLTASFSHLSVDGKPIVHTFDMCAHPCCKCVRPRFSTDFTSPRFCAMHKQEGMFKVTKGMEQTLMRFLKTMVKEGVFDAQKVQAAIKAC